MMNYATSDEILSLLQKEPPLTVSELSLLLNRTKADIRYHLKVLASEDKIIVIAPKEQIEKIKAGRPAARYTLTDQSYPNNLEEFLTILLSIIPLDDSMIQKLSSKIITQSNIIDSLSNSFYQRLRQIIIFLETRNYRAKWEISEIGPCIYFHNCPYKQIVKKHPRMCEFDRVLIENLSGHKTNMIKTINHQGSPCTFLLDIK